MFSCLSVSQYLKKNKSMLMHNSHLISTEEFIIFFYTLMLQLLNLNIS